MEWTSEGSHPVGGTFPRLLALTSISSNLRLPRNTNRNGERRKGKVCHGLESSISFMSRPSSYSLRPSNAMILRRFRPCSSLRRLPPLGKIASRPQCRLSLTSAASAAFKTPLIPPGWIEATSQLDQIAPRIDINADQIEILEGPQEFYEALKQKIRNAKTRIYLSTLYIGKTEHELVSTIHDVLTKAPDVKVSILTDALRGTREDPEPSCASLLASLVVDFPERVEIRMYHTPNLTGLRKRFIPKRINEGWGLQHIKLYGIDDEVILSGANLSSDYFTNRQDRYHVFSSKRVTNYFSRIHDAVCCVSFLLQPDTSSSSSSHTLIWPTSNPAPNPLSDPKGYVKAATSVLLPLSAPSAPSPTTSHSFNPQSGGKPTTTTIYPLLCHPPTLNTELPALQTLLASPLLRSYTFTAGYFNPHPLVTSSLLTASSSSSSNPTGPAKGTILTASPFANGFHNSPGISALLPPAYTHLSLRFLQSARRANAAIHLYEWRRGTVGHPGGWTYHAKGLWAYFSRPTGAKGEGEEGKGGVMATVIGSSNYTARSYGLDLEVGALVVTDDEALMAKLRREEEGLRAWTGEVGEEELGGRERRAGWRVRAAMWVVKAVGGSL